MKNCALQPGRKVLARYRAALCFALYLKPWGLAATLGTRSRDVHLLGMNSAPAQASLLQLQLPSAEHPWEEQGCSQPQFT